MTRAAPRRSRPVPDYRIVNRVVDSLDVRVFRDREPSPWLAAQLPEWRRRLQEWNLGDDLPMVDVPGLGAWELRRSTRPYEFLLVHPRIADVRVWNPEKWRSVTCGDTGQLYVSFRSVFLQFQGLAGAQRLLKLLRAALFHGSRRLLVPNLTYPDGFDFVSRADLAVDQARPSGLCWADLDAYVGRSRLRRDAFTTPWEGSPDEQLKKLRKPSSMRKTRSARADPYLGNKGCQDSNDQRTSGSPVSPFEPPPEGPMARAVGRAVRDLAAQLLDAQAHEGQAMVSRVVSVRDPQTVYFGRFGSALYAREYNKLLSLPTQGKLYMLDVWQQQGWDGNSQVWRVEFSVSGDLLRQFFDPATGERFDLRDLAAFAEAIPRVWSYLTRTWLRHCVPGSASNTARWKISPRWQAVQEAWPQGERTKRRRLPPRPDAERLRADADGRLVTVAAINGESDDAEAGRRALLDEAERLRLLAADPSFGDRYQERRKRLGLNDMTDTVLSANIRRERMAQGWGS